MTNNPDSHAAALPADTGWNPAELLDRLDGDAEAVIDVITIFLEDIPAMVADIRGAGQDLPRLAAAAHALKGASGNLAAWTVSTVAAEVEAAARGGNLPAAVDGRERLLHATGQLVVALERARNRPLTESA